MDCVRHAKEQTTVVNVEAAQRLRTLEQVADCALQEGARILYRSMSSRMAKYVILFPLMMLNQCHNDLTGCERI